MRGVTSFLVFGSTPAAAALLLTDSVLRPQRLRLITGALVTVPNHPWLVVWQHTWYDWTTGNLPFR